ncbi:PAS domain-containing protein [Cupriavidus basilensis]
MPAGPAERGLVTAHAAGRAPGNAITPLAMPFTVPDGASYADRLDRPAGSLPGTDGCLAAALYRACGRGAERDVLAAIVDAAPYLIAARDAGGRFVAANAALEAFLGIGRSVAGQDHGRGPHIGLPTSLRP